MAKGVVLTHGNMAASVLQLAAWIAHGLQDGSEVLVCPLPLHPHVAEVGAVGKLDERSGEVVKIIVVRKDPALTKEALLSHCRRHLSGCKVPKIVVFRIEPLSKSNLGRVLRRQLRHTPESLATAA